MALPVDELVQLERGNDTQCLLQDKWDFHWQRMYTYAAPVEKLPTLEPLSLHDAA